MKDAGEWAAPSSDRDLLDRLNRLSLTGSFIPESDIDWEATTSDAEYTSLYSAWSLLEGTGRDRGLDAAGREAFARYQQMNLMLFTGLLERHAVTSLAALYDLDRAQPFSEYIGHFIKEELYHYTMFRRAIDKIAAGLPPGAPRLPERRVDHSLRWLFRFLRAASGRKVRVTLTFTVFRFAEQVTMYAHQMAQKVIARPESLVRQVWAFHAMDETRHLAFDSMILERNRLRRPTAWVVSVLAGACCLALSLALNGNEIWAARRLGVRVRPWHLPSLMLRTTAPFKRQVFDLLGRTMRGWRAAA
jgi:para-aminobenzoate N-oxygenase AurF